MRMDGTDGREEAVDRDSLLRMVSDGVAAYNAHDLDAFRGFFASDFVGVDHRPGSLGAFDGEEFVAFTESLFAQVRSQHLVVHWIERRDNVGFFRTVENAETLDGVAVSFETLMVTVVDGEKTQRQDVFAPEAESDARALFEELASRSPGAARA